MQICNRISLQTFIWLLTISSITGVDMSFSKKERELLKKLKKNDFKWINRTFFPASNDKKCSWEECKRKHAYYRVLKNRIAKKVLQMENDLKLYNQVKDDWEGHNELFSLHHEKYTWRERKKWGY